MGEEEEKGSPENHDSRRRRRVEIAGSDTINISQNISYKQFGKKKYATMVSLTGHLFDKFLINEALDVIEAAGGSFHLVRCEVGQSADAMSYSELESHRSWRREFFVDRSSWKLPSPDAVEVPASVSVAWIRCRRCFCDVALICRRRHPFCHRLRRRLCRRQSSAVCTVAVAVCAIAD
ncbi:hypothetical protein EJ110_NYTH44023 [Nymphaea thermarum]|nr:hypothetical protein EJ110_NYTH44023 [Nymphaea thermarum]